jgi:ATP-dependent helicase HrpA
VKASADACEDLLLEGHGDILVFMPTERDIRETARVLQGRPLIRDSQVETVPLFGRLTEQEQNRVFAAHARRRIVIATNVAESSLTVPGIYCVVDPGTARISRFSATSQVQRLPIEPVSQASANQRAGRCGRVGPGVCVRLYSAEDFAARDAYTPPEILRTNLASVLLQMKSLHLGRIEEFPFLDPPGAAAVRAGLKTLFELNAIDEEENLTAIGKAMARLPVDPRIGRMILAGADEHCLSEVLIIASALELRDPRDRPLDKQQAADTAHARFRHERSDFMTLLKLWDFFIEQEEKQSNSKIRKVCQQNFLSYNRLREWKDLHRQLRDIVRDHGFKPTDRKNDEQAIHRAILCGTLSNVAQRGEGPEYTGAGGQKLYLWPGSVAFEGRPKWIMGAELVETTRRFVRMVGPLQPQWVESAAAHLVKRTYSEPFWNSKQAAVMAYEKVSLFGLVIVPRRECRYGPIDPKISRELFIQHALIEGDLQTTGEFFRHNAALKAEIAEWQAKVRQGLQFLGEEAEFDFYDQRLPAEVVDGPRFEQWRKTAELQHPRLLFLSREDLVVDTSAAPRAAAFPDTIRIGTMQVPVEYQLEPGSEADGVTLVVPSEGLNQLSEENLSWLVPGLLEEKVAAVMKTLPKSLRLLFVPIPETAARVAGLLDFGQGHLLQQLSETLRRISGEYVPVTAFEAARIPEHLKFNVRVIDRNGKIVAEGRELSPLRAVVQAQATQILEEKDSRWSREGIRHWNFGDLPEQVQLDRRGTVVVAFPMLIRREQDVALALAGSLEEAEARTRPALVQLYLLQAEKRLSEQVRHFPRLDELAVQLKILPGSLPLKSQVLQALARESLLRNGPLPRSEADWTLRLKQAQGLLPIVVQDLARILGPLLTDARTVQRLIGGKHPAALAPLVGDLRQQFAELFPDDFIAETPFGWMQHYGRYLQAMQSRFAKATSGGFEKDRRQMQLLLPYVQRFRERRARAGADWRLVPGLVQYRHLLEEFRVSLFAQQLRTAVPVSEKRLNELWASIPS